MATAYVTKVTAIPAPPSAGDIFWVDGFSGSDTNTGRSPLDPLATIAAALALCTNDHDDYIYVLDAWQEADIAINKTRVHIIGVGTSRNHPFVALNATGDTAIFTVSSPSNNCEIAGFSFGGGASHAGIENVAGTPMGLYIHDCAFGHSFAGNTPQDGIRIGANATDIRIEHCTFLGNGGSTGGTLTRDGIHWAGAADPLQGAIADNKFQGCPGVAINFVSVSGGISILDNDIACDADTQGAAITLGASVAGCLVVNNRAIYGQDASAMANNPYLDQAAAGSNHWAANYKGNVLVVPA